MSSTLIRNATIVAMDDAQTVTTGAVSVRDGRIAAVGAEPDAPHDVVIDAAGAYLVPGFIQTHLHLCQTLFRGWADDLPLMAWLRTRVWPMEAAHTPSSLRAAARLTCLDLLSSGTTSILTMETVHDTDAVIEAASGTGIRATVGKCLMDAPADGTPARLHETTQAALDGSLALHRHWHGAASGRIRVALAPRFAVSCSRDLLESVAGISARAELLVHSHACEQREEIAIVRAMTGSGTIDYLHATGLLSPRLCLAHGVWLEPGEIALLAAHDTKVLHCPGSNLKLGSGIAPVCDLLAHGITVSLGADGAACNNHLDMFGEMRLAAALQAVRSGPGSLPARRALWMATRAGARTLGLEDQIGSIEVGKQADLILVGRQRAHLAPDPDPYSSLVYAARPDDVRLTMVGGAILVRDGRPTELDSEAIVAEAGREAYDLAVRAGF